MKKKTRNLIVLCLCLVILLVGYNFLDTWKEKQETKVSQTEEEELIEVTEFEVADIASYSYRNSEYEIGFALTEEGYVNTEDAKFPAEESTVESQILAIAELEALLQVTGTDKAEYGLAEPQIAIEVVLESGTNRNFYIGDIALFEDAYYVLDVENDAIFLCEASIYDTFSVAWTKLVAKEEMSKPASDTIISVALETEDEAVFVLSYDETLEHPWQLTTADGTFDCDTDAVTDRLGNFSTYSVSKTIEYSCDDFSEYGLEPAATKVTVTYLVTDDAGVETEETLVFEFAAEETEDGVYYTRINHSDFVYGVTSFYMGELSEFELEELLYVEEETEEEADITLTEE